MTNILLLNMVIDSEFSHEKWWFSIAMLVYQRVYSPVIKRGNWKFPSIEVFYVEIITIPDLIMIVNLTYYLA